MTDKTVADPNDPTLPPQDEVKVNGGDKDPLDLGPMPPKKTEAAKPTPPKKAEAAKPTPPKEHKPPDDALDLDSLWLDPSLGDGLVDTHHHDIAIGKPKNFFRVNPDPAYRRRTEIYVHKIDGVIDEQHFIMGCADVSKRPRPARSSPPSTATAQCACGRSSCPRVAGAITRLGVRRAPLRAPGWTSG
jgi:hypothetical protein